MEMIHQTVVPPLLEAVLLDYKRNVPDAREAEVLAVITVLITKLQVRWTSHTTKYMTVRTTAPYKITITDNFHRA
jgi:exportin-1